MTAHTGRLGRTVVGAGAAGCVALLVGLSAASPSLARGAAHSRPATSTQTRRLQTANASFSAGVFQADFTAARAAGAAETQATGHFHATMQAGQHGSALASLDGPVTCLDVVGNRVGLFYPVNTSTPTALGQVMKGVYVYAQTGANGKPQSLSFVPSTSSTATSCDPTVPGLMPINAGYLSLTS